MYQTDIDIISTCKTDFIDVTEQVKKAVEDSGLKNGIVNVFTQHTTTAIRVNENEEQLMKDIQCFLEATAPTYKEYNHDDMEKRPEVPVDEQCNAHSHLKTLFMGASENIPIRQGRLAIGKWQSIFFVDLDGPRQRRMLINMVGK